MTACVLVHGQSVCLRTCMLHFDPCWRHRQVGLRDPLSLPGIHTCCSCSTMPSLVAQHAYVLLVQHNAINVAYVLLVQHNAITVWMYIQVTSYSHILWRTNSTSRQCHLHLVLLCLLTTDVVSLRVLLHTFCHHGQFAHPFTQQCQQPKHPWLQATVPAWLSHEVGEYPPIAVPAVESLQSV